MWKKYPISYVCSMIHRMGLLFWQLWYMINRKPPSCGWPDLINTRRLSPGQKLSGPETIIYSCDQVMSTSTQAVFLLHPRFLAWTLGAVSQISSLYNFTRNSILPELLESIFKNKTHLKREKLQKSVKIGLDKALIRINPFTMKSYEYQFLQ
jgi:hypothetical protein